MFLVLRRNDFPNLESFLPIDGGVAVGSWARVRFCVWRGPGAEAVWVDAPRVVGPGLLDSERLRDLGESSVGACKKLVRRRRASGGACLPVSE